MSTVNWNKFKCRSSAIKKMLATGTDGKQITEKQLAELDKLEAKESPTVPQKLEIIRLKALKDNKDKVVLGDTCIEYLMEVYAWETQGMIPVGKEALDMMQLRKGKEGEQEAGLLLSQVDGEIYLQDRQRIFNDYLSGEVDYYLGEDIYKATNVTDIKNSFDYPTFLKKINKGLENGQREQLAGYGDITGAKELWVANCLISFTPQMIEDMKWRILKKTGAATEESIEFLEEWVKFYRSMVFDQIPPQQRVFKIPVEPFTKFEQQKVYDRVKYCRDWLWKFDEMYGNMNK